MDIAFTAGAGVLRRELVLPEPTRVFASAVGPNQASLTWSLTDASGHALFALTPLRGTNLPGAFDLEAGRYVVEARYAGAALSTDPAQILLSAAPDRTVALTGRRWTDLEPSQPGERVRATVALPEGELVEWAWGVVGATAASWRVEDPYGQAVHEGTLRSGRTFGPWAVPEGTWTLVVEAGSSGLARADARVGRDLPGDLVAWYSRNDLANFIDPERVDLYRVGYAYGPGGIELGVRHPIADLPTRLDGIEFAPDGDLLAAGQLDHAIYKIDPASGAVQRQELPVLPREQTIAFGDFSSAKHVGVLPDGRTHKGHLEVFQRSGLVVLQYEADKKGETLASKLQRFTGTLVADAEHRHNATFATGRIVEAGCNAHGERKLEAAEVSQPVLAKEGRTFIQAIFAEEAKAREQGLDGDTLRTWRLERIGPLYEGFARWRDAVLPRCSPRSRWRGCFATTRTIGPR